MSSASSSSSSRRRRPRPCARPAPSPDAAAAASAAAPMSASTDLEWLWCDEHTKITQWFLAQPRLTYKEFYASFLNFANRAWELSRQKERAPLEGLEKFVVELLQKERIPAEELLTALQEYWAGLGEGKTRYKENGLVPFALGLGHQILTAGKNKLQAKVQGDLRKARNSLRVARLQAAAAANRATMATQEPLPAFVAPSSLPAFAAPPSSPMPVSDDLGPAAAAPSKRAQKATTLSTPVVFGSLPFVGGKKVNKEEDMDVEE